MEVNDNVRYAVDPREKPLFDLVETMFSPMAMKYMRKDWPGILGTQILHLMPVGKIAQHFHPTLGCPTKELYSPAGGSRAPSFKPWSRKEQQHKRRRYAHRGPRRGRRARRAKVSSTIPVVTSPSHPALRGARAKQGHHPAPGP